MIHLLGVNHSAQIRFGCKENTKADELSRCIRYLIEQNKEQESIIAEEYSNQVLCVQNAIHKLSCQSNHQDVCLGELVLEKMAKEQLVKHVMIDPDTSKRKEMKILSSEDIETKLQDQELSKVCKYLKTRGLYDVQEDRIKDVVVEAIEEHLFFPVREMYWFNQIKEEFGKDIFFVCGSRHIKTFKGLLDQKGVHWIESLNSPTKDTTLVRKYKQVDAIQEYPNFSEILSVFETLV